MFIIHEYRSIYNTIQLHVKEVQENESPREIVPYIKLLS